MKKHLLLPIVLVAVLLSGSTSFAQTPDLGHLMTENLLNCQDIAYNSLRLIPEYYDRGEVDSAYMVLDYWEMACGIPEQAARTRIVFSLLEGDRNYQNDPELLDKLLSYYASDESPYMYIYMPGPGYYTVPLPEERLLGYEIFIKQALRRKEKEGKWNRIDEFVAQYYSGNKDPLFRALNNNELEGTVLQNRYHQKVDDAMSLADLDMEMYAGAMIYDGNASALGVKPQIGFKIGGKKKGFLYHLLIDVRFLKSANTYQVYDQDSLFTTDKYFGYYMGLEGGYEFLKTDKHGLNLVAGIGYEGFTAVNMDADEDLDAVEVGSLNLHLGGGYRYYYTQTGSYIGLAAQYSFLDYNTHGGTDLSGNALSIRLSWGFSGNFVRTRQLEALRYEDKR